MSDKGMDGNNNCYLFKIKGKDNITLFTVDEELARFAWLLGGDVRACRFKP